MAAELEAIQVHLWVLTGLLIVILLAAGFCNYSRVKERSAVTPLDHMKDLWEREQFSELRNYTSARLKERPNASEVLMYHAMVLLHFKDYDEARRVTEKLGRSSPQYRKFASSLFEAVDVDATS
jgi:hypothetical protein